MAAPPPQPPRDGPSSACPGVTFGSFLRPILLMILHHAVLSTSVYAAIFRYAHALGLSSEEAWARMGTPDSFHALAAASDAQTVGSFYATLFLIPVYYLIFRFLRTRGRLAGLRDRHADVRELGAACAVIMGALGISQILMNGLLWLQRYSAGLARRIQNYFESVELMVQPASPFVFQVLTVAVMVPIAEELLFRGIIQSHLNRVTTRRTSVIVTTILFTVFHLSLVQGVYVFVAGLLISLVYAYTERLAVPIVMHMVFNFFGGGLFLRLVSERAADALGTVYLVFIAIGGGALAWLIRRDRKRRSAEAEA